MSTWTQRLHAGMQLGVSHIDVGILFHGPPGTGKTSPTFALGGVFNLSIYCVSLNDVGLTEEHLATLFSSLPARCIVLLEDVDTAGL
jgi:chaperone BCS1